MEPDSLSFLTLITKLQSHLLFGVGFPDLDSGLRMLQLKLKKLWCTSAVHCNEIIILVLN